MKTFLLLLVVIFGVANAELYEPQEVCYDDLGCFSTAPPFSGFGRVAMLPESPDKIGTRFLLYTKKNIESGQLLVANDDELLKESNFNGRLPTKFIVHGWNDGVHHWVNDMARQFLIDSDCNVIIVKWADAQSITLYAQAAANTRVVGAQVAQLVNYLRTKGGSNLKSFHILGHSMGAHVAGHAGERLPGLPRITGLDPADPYFQNFDAAVRLDETDAEFVDVVHADAGNIVNLLSLDGGLGSWQPSGHVDIYPNGGIHQPGCDAYGPITSLIGMGMTEAFRYIFGCNHVRGYEYPIEVINAQCPWRAYRCEGGWEEFKTGRCLKCPIGEKSKYCNSMVTRAVQPSDGSVNNMYWLGTGDKKPYCRYHFHVQLTMRNNDNKQQKGNVWVKLTGDDGVTTGFQQLGEKNFHMTPGATYDFLILTPKEISNVTAIELKWEHDANWYEIDQWQTRWPTIYPLSLNVFSGEFQKEKRFCDETPKDGIKSKETRTYTKAC